MSDDERWVSVASATTPMQLEMWRDLLEQEGIPAQIPGSQHWQMAGMWGANAFNVDLRVRIGDAERARDIIESLELGEPVEQEQGERDSEPPPGASAGVEKGPYRGDARLSNRQIQHKSPLVSAAVGLVITFGAAHFYAGEMLSGLVLAIAELFAFVLVVNGQLAGLIALVAVIAIDIGSGRNALNRANAGKRYPPLGQLARILPLVIGAGLFAALFLHGGQPR